MATAEVSSAGPMAQTMDSEKRAKLRDIPLKQIRESKIALRDVDKSDDKYKGLVESIRKWGIMNPINVRELGKEDGEMVYSLVDGLQRYNASADAGKTHIPANVMDLTAGQVLEAQIIANVHRIEMKKFQYAKQLDKILAENPFLTMSELATRLAKSPTWLNDQLGLTKLPDNIGDLVDEGKINLSNAYVLSRLPKEEMTNFIERAMTQQPAEFAPQVHARVKEVREAKRQGREARGETFVATAYLHKIAVIKEEIDHPKAIAALLEQFKPRTPIEAAILALKWTLHSDPTSLVEAERKYREKKEQDKAEKDKRDKEKTTRKALEARETAEKLQAKAKESGIDLDVEKARLAQEKAEAAAAEANMQNEGDANGEPYEPEPE